MDQQRVLRSRIWSALYFISTEEESGGARQKAASLLGCHISANESVRTRSYNWISWIKLPTPSPRKSDRQPMRAHTDSLAYLPMGAPTDRLEPNTYKNCQTPPEKWPIRKQGSFTELIQKCLPRITNNLQISMNSTLMKRDTSPLPVLLLNSLCVSTLIYTWEKSDDWPLQL